MFRVEGLERAECEPTGIRTPLGVVVHTVTLDRYVLPESPCAAWRLPTGARLYRWRDRAATVELVTGSVDRQSVSGALPVAAWSAIWQVHAHRRIESSELSAELMDIPPGTESGPDTGECLEAVTVETEDTMVSIGGPDDESLRALATSGRHLPARWRDEIADFRHAAPGAYAVRYDDPAKITWRLPSLHTEESFRFCLTVAAAPVVFDQPAAWFAVNFGIDAALAQLGPHLTWT
ncbi:hypothetical protein ACWIGI_05450 [Nocardia sp. NPDC055321]